MFVYKASFLYFAKKLLRVKIIKNILIYNNFGLIFFFLQQINHSDYIFNCIEKWSFVYKNIFHVYCMQSKYQLE